MVADATVYDIDVDRVFRIAKRAASTCSLRYAFASLSYDEYEEWYQEAIYGITAAMRGYPGHADAYYWTAGVQHVTRWLFRTWWKSNIRTTADIANGTADHGVLVVSPLGTAYELDEWQLIELEEVLAVVLYDAPRAGGPASRRDDAVQRDLFILQSRLRGMTDQEIADDLGLPRGHVRKYRQALLKRLGRIKSRIES